MLGWMTAVTYARNAHGSINSGANITSKRAVSSSNDAISTASLDFDNGQFCVETSLDEGNAHSGRPWQMASTSTGCHHVCTCADIYLLCHRKKILHFHVTLCAHRVIYTLQRAARKWIFKRFVAAASLFMTYISALHFLSIAEIN